VTLRPILAASLAVGLAILPVSVASANPGAGFGGVNRGRDGTLLRDVSANAGSAEPEVEQTSGSSDDGLVWVGTPRLGAYTNDEGETVYCRTTRWVRAEPGARAQLVADAQTNYYFMFASLPELQGSDPNVDCPIEPTESVPPVVLREAITHTIRDDLPRPELEVPPGYALTGMPAFLVTNHALEYGPVTHTVDLGVTVLDVTVTATGSTHVDWGDGHAQTYDAPGTAWPHGQVVHTYRDTGHVDITVTDTWQVTYRVPSLGIEDSVEAALPARTLEGLEIQQVQAVRVSD
jgi:hypothetical protein